MSPRKTRCGSALVGAIWTLAVLSILIASYAVDAHLQTRINLYLRERVTVDHLTDAGIAIAEVILLDYKNVETATGDTTIDYTEKLEDDRWYKEKVELKSNQPADTGAVPVDALNPDGGTVRVEIKPIESKWNINKLYPEGDPNYDKIWEAILTVCGVPEDYWGGIIDSWCDWRDSDETKTGDDGAESEYYAQAYDDDPVKHPFAKSRNGEIADLDELMNLKGFNEYEDKPISAAALMDGGVLNPDARRETDKIQVKGMRKFFSVYGNGKINVNIADEEVLSSVPGIFIDEEVDQDIVNAIIEARQEGQNQAQTMTTNGTRAVSSSASDEVGMFKNWNDLQTRTNGQLQQETEQYLSYEPAEYFEITITGSSMGITHAIKAVVLIQNSKVCYIRWQEEP